MSSEAAAPGWLTSVTLTKQITLDTEDPAGSTPAHFIRIVATTLDNDGDAAIFVHQLEVIDSLSPDVQAAFFTNVCTPADYNELPVGLPGVEDNYILFRSAEVRHFARSREELDFIWTTVQAEVASLVDAFKRAAAQYPDSDESVVIS